MPKFIAHWLADAVGIAAAVYLLPGIELGTKLSSILWLAFIFGLVNGILRPIMKVFTFPIIVLTLGLFSLVLNTFLFWLSNTIGNGFGVGLHIANPVFWNAFLGGIVVSIVSTIVASILKDDDKKKKKRH